MGRHLDSATLTAMETSGAPVTATAIADKTRAQRAPGSKHGASIKNPATYEALKRGGKSKSSAAAISNWALNQGYRKGVKGGRRKS